VGPRLRAVAVKLIVASMLVSVFAVASFAGELPPGGTFSDDNGNVHEGNIEAIAAQGITNGCNPPANDRFCPDAVVSRGQMAALLGRALNLPATSTDFFSDDDGTLFEADINRLAAAGITRGCDPPASDAYCPEADVTRGEMAAFLVRAFEYSDTGGGGAFVDTGGSVFAGDIDRLAAAGVTKGCNPPDNDRYCPDDEVQRDQMASFLARALGLSPVVPEDPSAWPGCATQSSISEFECGALVALYNMTAGDQWTQRTGWLTDPDPCTWYRVTCSAGSVTEITLDGNQLSGSIPIELASLTGLTRLVLSSNELSGSLPPELGSLTNLARLWMSGNPLSGSLPPELGNLANLTDLRLGDTALSGQLPPELGNLTNLTDLYMDGAQLSGSIPIELGNLGNLRVLSLTQNQLSGSIPAELGDLANLRDLWLVDNELSGSVPAELGSLTNLKELRLDTNQLSGPVPTALQQLDGTLTGLTLHGQVGCLTASTPELATWIGSFDTMWNDGCTL
jgi:Leucine Rich Repeat